MKPSQDIRRVTRSKDAARAAYDRLSRWYDLVASGEGRCLRPGLARLNVRAGERVLEIGFGTGRGLLALARSVGVEGKVQGIDLSEGMLRVAQARVDRAGFGARVELKRGDATALPFESGSLDAVFMSFTLELFDTPEIPIVLRECWRVLRAGGRICVVAMAKPREPRLTVRIYEWAHDRFPAFIDCRPIFAGESIEEAGFSVLEVTRRPLHGLPVEIVLAEKPGGDAGQGVSPAADPCRISSLAW